MKRFVFAALLFVVVECLLSPSLAHAEERVVSQPPQLVIKSVTAGLSGRANYEYVELYNPNTQDIILDSWIFTHLRKEGSETQSFTLHGTISAKSSVLFAGSDTELTALSPDFSLKESSIVTTGGIVRLVDNKQTLIDELRWGDVGTTGSVWPLSTGTTLQRRFVDGIPVATGDTKQDFQVVQVTINTPGSGGYIPYSAPIATCDGVIISEIGANVSDDRQFIELYNESNVSVTLDGCLLQTNRSLTKSYELTGNLASGEYHAYYVADMDLQLTKTTAGSVYLLASDGKSETDVRSYDSLPEETSWAWYGVNDWRQTYALTPSDTNIWQEFLPCEAGYERSADTGRCRKAVSETVVPECEAGKYRNPDTGRCRAVENPTTMQLGPCAPDQYRSPDTNRCRSTVPLAAEPAACKEGQERNPETNRCRVTTTAIPASDFPVEPVQEAGKTFVGWWVLGGVGSMGLVYAGWEWRREATELIKRASSVFGLGK